MPQRRQETRRFLATVLFTDIVGSTQHAAELGDRAWRDLLERHNAIVRRELKAYRGREMDTAGDGFFAVFESPERAVRCAESITVAVASLGIAVRAGVHMGECEVIGGKVAGMAVTIGARVMGLAGPGEVLVSGSVRDLMTGSDRHFDGGELQELKGVTDQWRVYRLVPEEVNGDAVTSSRRTSMVPLYTRRQRRRLVGAVAAVTVVVLATAGGYVLTRPEPMVTVGENAVGVIGPGDQPRVSAAVGVGQRPSAIASGFGSVWVTNSAADSVSRIDQDTHLSVPINLEQGSAPSGIDVGAGAVWVANSGNSTVSRIDPKTSRVTPIPVAPGPTGIVVAFDSVWVTNALDAKVTEIDPDTNKTVEVSVGAGPTGIAAGGGYVWVTNQGDGTVTRFDPKTYVKDPVVKVGSGPVGIAFADGAAWVANNVDGSLSRIDAVDLSEDSRALDKDGGAYGVAAHGPDVWVSNEHAGNLMRVTAGTFLLSKTVPVPGAPLGMAFVGDELWFTSAEGGRALHRGGVLTAVGPALPIGQDVDPLVLDPTVQYDEGSWRLNAVTNDGLVSFRRAGGVQGSNLVPDLATAVPQPTDGGLTYTFHLRRGVRYSTGAPVLAGDIRRGIERSIVHASGPGPAYFGVIVDSERCIQAAADAVAATPGLPLPDCDLGRGIVTDDRSGTVTFHLTEATPEFVYQLTTAFAVPQDTPVDLAPNQFLPATGPYMIASYLPKREAKGHLAARPGRLELVRNPMFREWSPAAQPAGYPDQIMVQTGFTPEQATTRVADGRADLLWGSLPTFAQDGGSTRFSAQLHTNTGQFTGFVFLNVEKPPFDNLEARRAVAFALDRDKIMSEGQPGPPTCQLIPPAFGGYRPYCPFTSGDRSSGRWTAPDIATARALVARSGTRGAKLVLADPVFGPPGSTRRISRDVVAALRQIGYRASVRAHPGADFAQVVHGPRSPFNGGMQGWGADYPAGSNFVTSMGLCQGRSSLSGYCDKALDRRINAAIAQQVTDPGSANDTWAALDRNVVDAAAVIPFGNSERKDFVSRRVSHLLVGPITGPVLSQMWVQ